MNWAQLNVTVGDVCQSTSIELTEKEISQIRATVWQNFNNGRFAPEQLTDNSIEASLQTIIVNYVTSASSVQALQVKRDIQAWDTLKEWAMPLIGSYLDEGVSDGRISAVWHNVSITILQTEFDYLHSLEEWVTHLITQTVDATQLFSPKSASVESLLDDIGRLPDLAQKILLMYHVDNLSLGEIANKLALPLSIIMQTQFLAEGALKNKVTIISE